MLFVKERGSVFIEFEVISKPSSKRNYYWRGGRIESIGIR